MTRNNVVEEGGKIFESFREKIKNKPKEFVRIEKYDTMLSEDDGIENYTALDMIFPLSSSLSLQQKYRIVGGKK